MNIIHPPQKVRDWRGCRVVSKVGITTHFFQIPAGTTFTIELSGPQKWLISDTCSCCGLQARFTTKRTKDRFLEEFDFIDDADIVIETDSTPQRHINTARQQVHLAIGNLGNYDAEVSPEVIPAVLIAISWALNALDLFVGTAQDNLINQLMTCQTMADDMSSQVRTAQRECKLLDLDVPISALKQRLNESLHMLDELEGAV